MTVLQDLRDGDLCGMFPRELHVVRPDGTRALWRRWRGDRGTWLALARELLARPEGTRMQVVVAHYRWHTSGPRECVESTLDFTAQTALLLAEEAERQGRRSAARSRQVNWRAGVSTTATKIRRAGSGDLPQEAPS